MIISENTKPALPKFAALMERTDVELNEIARQDTKHFVGHGGKALEQDIYDVLTDCAKGTDFEGSIQLVSGAHFPDIVAHKYYGVEVKSTEKDAWTSIGSSILESTRIPDVERIYLTFGKLGGKTAEFKSRPYEEVMADISVTHYPRYRIDMRLEKGKTIFDKMQIEYDALRKLDDPVAPVSEYYASQLKPGEKLWWARPDSPPIIRFWTNLDAEYKKELMVIGFILFPEVLNGEYNNFSMWLVTEKGIINPNVRDTFSAGGKVDLKINGSIMKLPAVYSRLHKYREMFWDKIDNIKHEVLENYWEEELYGDRKEQWLNIAAGRVDLIVENINTRIVLDKLI